MKKFSYVLQNINVLNLLLLTAAVVMFFTMVYPLLDAEMDVDVPAAKKDNTFPIGDVTAFLSDHVLNIKYYFQPFMTADLKVKSPNAKEDAAKKEEPAAANAVPSVMDYVMVAEKNLFHPERRMPTDKNVEPEMARPEIIYYGSIITQEKKIAYIEDKKNPYSTPGRGKRQKQIVEGAMIGGYKLAEVNPETLVLVRGEDKMVVNLRDEKDRKAPETAAKQQPLPQFQLPAIKQALPKKSARPQENMPQIPGQPGQATTGVPAMPQKPIKMTITP